MIVAWITPDVSPVFTGITRFGDVRVELTWTGAPGDMLLDYSLDLTAGSWFEIAVDVAILDGESSGMVSDVTIAPTQAQVFHRIRVRD